VALTMTRIIVCTGHCRGDDNRGGAMPPGYFSRDDRRGSVRAEA